jgi:response regulator RpfG family c-di-GMP phosphodiesterase
LEPIDYKAYPILFVDDESENLDIFSINFRDTFTIRTARSGPEGLALLARESVALVLSDQRMPDMSGMEFLQEVQRRYPDIVRILVTAYSDLDFAAENTTAALLYSYVLKPWEGKLLRMLLMRGIEQYHLVSNLKRLEAAPATQRLPSARAPEIVREIDVSLAALRTYLERIPKKIAALPLSDPGRLDSEFWAQAGTLSRDELARIRSLISELAETGGPCGVERKGRHGPGQSPGKSAGHKKGGQ